MANLVAMKRWLNCTPQEKIERWVNVERVLDALSPHEREKHFDMRSWGYVNDCGTVGCAGGLCSLDPWFRSQGWAGVFILKTLVFDDGTFTGANMSDRVGLFFGPSEYDPSTAVFLDISIRPVEAVIKEVREHIAELRTGMPSP